MSFPNTLDNGTTIPNNQVDGSGRGSPASDNNVQANAIIAIETKIGINGSADPTTLDYKAAHPYASRIVTPVFAISLTPNSDVTDIYRLTLTGNTTINTPTGSPIDGQNLILEVTQDTTGSRLITWGAGYAFSIDNPTPTLTATPNKTDVIGFKYTTAGNVWRLLAINHGF